MYIIELDAETERQLAHRATQQSRNVADLVREDLAEYLQSLNHEVENRPAANAGLTYDQARQLALNLLQKPFAMGDQYERNRDALHER